MSRACVIGAGIGGLALAIRLQVAGIATTLVEARAAPGGRATAVPLDGLSCDYAPGLVTDPAALDELWAIAGRRLADDIALLPVAPFRRLAWPDGTTFDLSGDETATEREVARIAPADLAGWREFGGYAARAQLEGHVRLGTTPLLDLATTAKVLPGALRLQGWRSLHAIAAAHVRSGRLREVLSAPALDIGGNPLTVSALAARVHRLEAAGGVWWPQGGMRRVGEALAALFTAAGGTLRLHDPVVQVHAMGDRVSEVEAASGWRERFDAVASNADLVHTYRALLSASPRGPEMAGKLARRRWSPGQFTVSFVLEGSWPGIPHRTILFGPRFEGLLADIFAHGVLPRDMLIDLHHPSVTEAGLAPAGRSLFQATIPVANLARLPVDWEQIGPVIERRVLDEIGRRLIPDLPDRLVASRHASPRDLSLDFNAWVGAAHAIEPLPRQSGWLRGHNRDARLRNLYLVGAGVHPGAGLPGVIAGARITARLMLEDMSR